jgi:hypothetical protein
MTYDRRLLHSIGYVCRIGFWEDIEYRIVWISMYRDIIALRQLAYYDLSLAYTSGLRCLSF